MGWIDALQDSACGNDSVAVAYAIVLTVGYRIELRIASDTVRLILPSRASSRS